MSHTYKDESGVVFIFNSDLSGDVTIRVLSEGSARTYRTVEIPADALSRFLCLHFFDTEEMIDQLDRLKEWLTKHTNAVTRYRADVSTLGPITPNIDPSRYKFAPGDKVFLTFSEANGETGVVTDVGRHPSEGGSYEYADVKLDKDGTQTGPLPVTCVRARRPEDQG